MSWHLCSEVYKRQLGTLTRVAVMALLADKASDNGEGIWSAKQSMADELCTTKQTVIATIKGLVADDLLREVGHRKCQNGYLVEYAINVRALKALPLVKVHLEKEERSSSLTGQAALPVNEIDLTGQAALPDQSSSLTQTSLEPSLKQEPPNPLGRGRERVAIADDWILPGVADLPDAIAALARQWPPGAYATEGAAFHQHWLARGTRRLDWGAAWAARVQARHAEVMRAGKAGVSFVGAAAAAVVPLDRPRLAAKELEDGRSRDLHQALIVVLGEAVWAKWFEPAALVFRDEGLVLVAPSAFHAAHIEGSHRASIELALAELNRGAEWMRFDWVARFDAAAAGKGRRKRA